MGRTQLVLDAAPSRDVDDRGDDELRVLERNPPQPDLDGDLRAVLAASEEFAPCARGSWLRVLQEALAKVGMLRPPGIRHEHVHGMSQQLGAAVAEQTLDLVVCQYDDAIGVDHQHADREPLECRPEELGEGICDRAWARGPVGTSDRHTAMMPARK